jgi:hypothetical protein
MARPPKSDKVVSRQVQKVLVMQAGTGKKRFIADIPS